MLRKGHWEHGYIITMTVLMIMILYHFMKNLVLIQKSLTK